MVDEIPSLTEGRDPRFRPHSQPPNPAPKFWGMPVGSAAAPAGGPRERRGTASRGTALSARLSLMYRGHAPADFPRAPLRPQEWAGREVGRGGKISSTGKVSVIYTKINCNAFRRGAEFGN